MAEWEPDHLLQYNLSPKSTTLSNAPDPRLEVGTEPAIRYLENTYHTIAETKKWWSENQLHDNRLEVDHNQNTLFSLFKEIGHHRTPPYFHIYVDPLVPTDLQIFVMHKMNAAIFWLVNIHNQLYDIQTLRTLNTSHQNSRRDNIRALHTFLEENHQIVDFTGKRFRTSLSPI